MSRIKSYIEYIKELRTVVSHKSGSGHTKQQDLVYTDPTSAMSPSARVLLRQQLFDQDPDSNLDVLSPKQRQWFIAKNNVKFLRDKRFDGELRCEYCNEGPLKIYNFNQKFNKKDGATVDHKIPQSKGGPILDYDNLAVCCYKCNQDKGDMSFKDWMDFVKKEYHQS